MAVGVAWEDRDLVLDKQVSEVEPANVEWNEDIEVKLQHLSIVFPALFLACNSSLTETLDSIEQEYLFEVEYVNHAWGLAWKGVVIDREGNIHAYDHSQEIWDLNDNGSFSKMELEEKYAHEARYIGRIDEATIVQQFARIGAVDDDPSDLLHLCADAGGLTYRAFRYDSASGLYHPLLLRLEGDFAKQNSSNAAEDLAEWLRSLLLNLDDAGVQPFNEGVCTP